MFIIAEYANIDFWFNNYTLDLKYPIYVAIPELEIILVTFQILLKYKI